MRFGPVLLLLLALASAARAADDEPTTTPYRPSVSTPAALSAPGWLEIEAGWQHNHADDARRDSIPLSFKLAFDRGLGHPPGQRGLGAAALGRRRERAASATPASS